MHFIINIAKFKKYLIRNINQPDGSNEESFSGTYLGHMVTLFLVYKEPPYCFP